jgi:hypothetical protein
MTTFCARELGLVLVAVAAAAPACTPASAAAPPAGRTVLVELFTSEGCSSCPPADAFVAELPRLGWGRDRVVPLTFHVDYWDALGWKDPFASPAFTARQRRYAEAGVLRAPAGEEGIRGLYTPQMVVDGAVHFSGGRRDVALAELRRAAAAPPAVEIVARARLEAGRAVVTAEVTPRTAAAAREPWRLVVAVVLKKARTRVARGENAGETLEEAAIVRALSPPVPVPRAPGAPVEVAVARPADHAWSELELAVFVQSETTLRVGGAAAVAGL